MRRNLQKKKTCPCLLGRAPNLAKRLLLSSNKARFSTFFEALSSHLILNLLPRAWERALSPANWLP